MLNLWNRWLVTPPAVWGKLPSHADYVRHRVGFQEDALWQNWLLREVGERAFETHGKTRHTPRTQEPWLRLDAAPPRPGPDQVPIAFALPAKTLHQRIGTHVIGVLARSEDSRGRPHPLIIYQFCSPRWLRRCFTPPAPQEQATPPGWLYWLSRLMVRYIHPHAQAAMPVHQAVDELWSEFAPRWLYGLRPHHGTPDAARIQDWLQRASLPKPPEHDAMQMLHGVQHLPWLDWPERVWQNTPGQREPLKSYWQHDAVGGYVGASSRLPELWD